MVFFYFHVFSFFTVFSGRPFLDWHSRFTFNDLVQLFPQFNVWPSYAASLLKLFLFATQFGPRNIHLNPTIYKYTNQAFTGNESLKSSFWNKNLKSYTNSHGVIAHNLRIYACTRSKAGRIFGWVFISVHRVVYLQKRFRVYLIEKCLF